jgi:Fe-S cluster biogenesis protein NfuA
MNEKGLYRKGGSCFGCGSVRHTLKDCPERHKKKYL